MTTFAQIQLIEPIQRALAEQQYRVPTPIQQQTIPEALGGRDILGCAQTGTGKTAAFALPILNNLSTQHVKAAPRRPAALVLAPTRELAIQIAENCAAYGRHLKVRQAVIYGGIGQASQVQALQHGVHLLIATPGRLLDLMQQGHLSLDQLRIFVLDEADRMMDMGFLPDLKRIIAALPARRQSLFFSATLPPDIVKLARNLLHDPVSVTVTPQSSTVELIDQRVMLVERHQKRAVLLKILNSGTVGQTLVFTRTKRGANQLAQQLCRDGIEAAAIHGNKSQNARQRALDEFRREKIQTLVATDLAARGIDIDRITHVINFDLPHEPESYVHRIGRTGRAGETGIAISLVDSSERADLQAIQRLIGKKITVIAPPTVADEPARASTRQRATPQAETQHTAPRHATAGRDRSGKTASRAPAVSRRAVTARPVPPEDMFGDGIDIPEQGAREPSGGEGSSTGRRRRRGRQRSAGSTGESAAVQPQRRAHADSAQSSQSKRQSSESAGSDKSAAASRPRRQAAAAAQTQDQQTGSRRAFGRRPNRRATEEYKAAGGRRAAAQRGQGDKPAEGQRDDGPRRRTASSGSRRSSGGRGDSR